MTVHISACKVLQDQAVRSKR